MLAPLALSTKQLIIGSVVLSAFFPCIAVFVILLRELGVKNVVKSTGIMLTTALLAGGILNLIL
jgi:ferrous iron transport protein B